VGDWIETVYNRRSGHRAVVSSVWSTKRPIKSEGSSRAAVVMGLITGYVVWGAVILGVGVIFSLPEAGHPAAALFACSVPILPAVVSLCAILFGVRDLII
jgi:hypothetical protein